MNAKVSVSGGDVWVWVGGLGASAKGSGGLVGVTGFAEIPQFIPIYSTGSIYSPCCPVHNVQVYVQHYFQTTITF